MRDHSPISADNSDVSADNSDVCAYCGQPLHTAAPSYGDKRNKRTGLIVTVLLHLLIVAIYLIQPKTERRALPPDGAAIVYVAPLPAGKPKPKTQEQAPPKPRKSAPKKETIDVPRLPNTITLPRQKPVEVVKEEPKQAEPTREVTQLPPEVTDMAAYIEARRRQRGAQAQSDQPAEESEDARATRIAKANVAAANSRSRDDSNETGGVFSISNQTFHSADLKFRGWNPNFKRRWLTQLTVEQGAEIDLETAVVKKMIELIRKEKTGDFEWDSHRLGRVITMSARPQDTAQLQAFLMKEMFPKYSPPGR